MFSWQKPKWSIARPSREYTTQRQNKELPCVKPIVALTQKSWYLHTQHKQTVEKQRTTQKTAMVKNLRILRQKTDISLGIAFPDNFDNFEFIQLLRRYTVNCSTICLLLLIYFLFILLLLLLLIIDFKYPFRIGKRCTFCLGIAFPWWHIWIFIAEEIHNKL